MDSYDVDRLSRNSIDTGRLIYLMDLGLLKEIRTPSQIFQNTPNDKFMINIFCGAAKLENDNKGINVKRGLKKKAEMGWFPACLHIGYMNDISGKKGFKEIQADPDRFPLVRKMFDLMIEGMLSPPKIRDIAVSQWGLQTRRGSKLSRSGIYRIFTNPFYYGLYEFPKGSGNWYQGKHQPMITIDEYDRIQALLGRKGNPRPKSYIRTYTGIIHCGECGASITSEEKNQVICSSCKFKFSYKNRDICPKCGTLIENMNNPTFLKYVYYHCTKRKDPNCSQGVIEEKDLEKQILDILERIKIPPEFHDWIMKHLRIDNQEEAAARTHILNNQRKRYTECINKLDALIEMRVNREISEEEFIGKRSTYLQDKQRMQELLNDSDERVNKWVDAAEQVFIFARDAKKKFETGTAENKKQILQALGSNLTLKDKVLTVKIEKPLVLIEKISQEVKSIIEKLEPNKTTQNSVYSKQLNTDCFKRLPSVDDVRTCLTHEDYSIFCFKCVSNW